MKLFLSATVRLVFFSSLLITSLFESAFAASDTNTAAVALTKTTQNADDQCRLGGAYFRGEGVSQSYEQAGYWYRKAAEQGNPKAMNNLGLLFLDGLGTSKNETEGYRWLRKAAEANYPVSQYLVGTLLIKGQGTTKNPTEGLNWISKAADSGYADAIARLGQAYYFGEFGLKKDLSKAVPLIKSAAQKGNPWACETLGILYFHGEGVPKNEDEANYWITRSHRHGA